MKLYGEVNLTLVDKNTGNVINEIIDSNTVMYIAEYSLGGGFGNIGIHSGDPYLPINDRYTLGIQSLILSQVSTTTFVDGDGVSSNAYVEFYTRFDPPAPSTTRLIKNLSMGRTTAYFQIPGGGITQTDITYIDIRWRIFCKPVPGRDYTKLKRIFKGKMKIATYDATTLSGGNNSSVVGHYSYANASGVTEDNYKSLTMDLQNEAQGTYTQNYFYPLLRFDIKSTFSVAQMNGRVLGSFISGGGRIFSTSELNDTMINVYGMKPPLIPSNMQPLFPHASTATHPFYVSTTAATGVGLVSINEETPYPNSKFPTFVKVDITNTGDVGTATYRIKTRKTFGFNGLNYQNKVSLVPFVPSFKYDSAYPTDPTKTYRVETMIKQHGMGVKYINSHNDLIDYKCIPYDDSTIITWDNTGLTKLNLMSGEYKTWDSTTIPSLPVEEISQIEVDFNGIIWVACRKTGLYTVTESVVTNVTPSTTKACVGVDHSKQNGGTTYALFSSGVGGNYLGKTNDGGTTWDLYDDNTSPYIQTYVIGGAQYIKVDPSATNGKIAIIRNVYPQVVWWDGGLGGGLTYGPSLVTTTPSPVYNQTFLNVSDNNSGWFLQDYGSSVYKLSFGLTTKTSIGLNTPGHYVGIWFDRMSTNEDALVFPYLFTTFKYMPVSGTVMSNVTMALNVPYTLNNTYNLGYSSKWAYFGNGVFTFLSSTGSGTNGAGIYRQLIGVMSADTSVSGGTASFITWDEYGWNGSQWVKNLTSSKTTHSSYESIPHGLQIKFENGTTPGTKFVSTEYYTTAVMNGFLKDNATSLDNVKISSYFGDILQDSVFELPVVTDTAPYVGTRVHFTGFGTVDGNLVKYHSGTPAWGNYNEYPSYEALVGDFEVKWNISEYPGSSNYAGFGIGNLVPTSDGSGNPMWVQKYGFWGGNGTLNVYLNGGYVTGVSAGTGNVSISIRRTGSTIRIIKNVGEPSEAVLYTFAGSDSSYMFTVCNRSFSPTIGHSLRPIIIQNGTIPHTIFGNNGTLTGAYHPRLMGFDAEFYSNFNINVDGVPLTVTSDASVAPSASQVLVTMGGLAVFHPSHVGKTITGDYKYIVK